MEQHWRTLIWCIHNIGAHCLPHQGWAGIAVCSEMVILGSLLISAPAAGSFCRPKCCLFFSLTGDVCYLLFNWTTKLRYWQFPSAGVCLQYNAGAASQHGLVLTAWLSAWLSKPPCGGCAGEVAKAIKRGRDYCSETLQVQDELGGSGLESLIFFFVYTECVGVLKWCCCDSMAEVFFAPATLTITCSSHASGRHAAVLIQVSWRCALLCSCQGKVTAVKCFGKGWTQRLFCSRECWSLKETWCCGRRYWAKICVG